MEAKIVPEWHSPTSLEPAFETKRLRVFYAAMQPNDDNLIRDVFIAFRTDEDRPMVCGTAVVWYEMGRWFDWLEITSEYRRQGFATELVAGIKEFYGGKVTLEPGSESGKAFLEAIA